MKKSKLISYGLLHSLSVLLYTAAVAWLMFNGERFFGKAQNFTMPLTLLLLFVLSATIVGLLVLGRPIYMYFNGHRQEGIKLLIYTLVWLAIITIIILAAQAMF